MVEPVENFLSLDRAAELVAEEAGIARGKARSWITDLVQSGDVRLQDRAGKVTCYEETPEVAAERAACAAQRPAPGRYNPNSYARLRRERSSSPPAPRPPSAIEQIWAAGYSVGLRKLEKALVRKYKIEVDLCAAASKSAAPIAASSSVGPAAQLLEFLRVNGPKAEFKNFPQDLWRRHASCAGILFTDADFASAWRMGVQAGYVEPLKGAPPVARQSKRAQTVSDLSSQPQEARAAVSDKVGRT